MHSLSVGGLYERITNYRKPIVTDKSIHWCHPLTAAKLREASQDHWPIDCSPPCGLSLLQKRSKQDKLELCNGLTGGQLAKHAFRLLDSLHRRIRAIVEAEGGHMSH